eukprot:CAMPEP_0183296162 /NCGR_PEP_ID=MMETSP0160_2-20130417/3844_1 /TAXON_ID=2839 ORGANISM="Odontella Sinensis, Strain Grunow 1884" /NCGR_SAMPLE_ID=MMETSP0160_2 /ASSEMBLY_ACC=CAM_ASM_000250 /LENGTH=64 /DNA_ID=CAMNT_0025457753 /DNA_START=577 /DNA_END=768 /DNA_ORIENTATION=-
MTAGVEDAIHSTRQSNRLCASVTQSHAQAPPIPRSCRTTASRSPPSQSTAPRGADASPHPPRPP